MKKNLKLKCLLLLVFLVIASLAGCNTKEEANTTPQATPTSKYTETAPLIDMDPLVFSFVNTESKLSAIEKWQHLADYLTAKTGIPIEIKIFDNDAELIDSFSIESTDIALVDSLAYIRASEEENITLILRSLENGGSPFTRSYIITKSNSNLNSIEDLKGKKFAFTDQISASGYLFPRVMLAKEGINDINNYFSEIEFIGDEQSSFLAVYNGYADAGVVSESIMKKDDMRLKEIKVISKTEDIPLGTVIVRSDLDEPLINKLTEALMGIGNTLDSVELIKKIKIDGFVKAEDSDYNIIRENLKALNELGEK